MKKNKLLIGLLSTAAVASSLTPIVTLTSCGWSNNLMREYTPTIKPAADKTFDTQADAVDEYLRLCEENTEIFAQDLLYTLSRGMPQYNAYISEFCEISEASYGAKVSNISVNRAKKQVSFDLTMKIVYDYSLTKREELEFYDLGFKKWNTTTVANFVFDFDTTKCNLDPYAYRRQMTTYAGATQFGICEFNSTVQMLSQKGWAIDLDGKKVNFNETIPGRRCHFILPSYEYAQAHGSLDNYAKCYAEAWDLWLNYWGIQALVLSFKYYMPSNFIGDSADNPRTLDFGSYHMQNANLSDFFTHEENILYGFNTSLDSIKNLQNLRSDEGKDYWDEGSKTITLPDSNWGAQTCYTIAPYAFDAEASNYTNLGVPNNTKTIVIPSNYHTIQQYAFNSSTSVEKLVIGHEGSENLELGSNCFYQMLGLNEIDFSAFGAEQSGKITGPTQVKPFAGVHLGNIYPEGTSEGTIIVNKDCTDAQLSAWKSKLFNLGLKIWEDGISETGWKVERAKK